VAKNGIVTVTGELEAGEYGISCDEAMVVAIQSLYSTAVTFVQERQINA
jgi:hypothetical protein